MKNSLLIIGGVDVVSAVLALVYAALNRLSYKTLRDGSAEHYKSLRKRSTLAFIAGGVLILAGSVCVIVYNII